MIMRTTIRKERHPYKRDVTHTEYKHKDKKVKKGGWSRMLHQHITDEKISISKETVAEQNVFYTINDKYMTIVPASHVLPFMGGGFFLLVLIFVIIGYTRFPAGEIDISYILFSLVPFFGLCFFIIYYFTMPEKEIIFNREDGVITFPGFLWRLNITMPIKKVIFSRSAPSAQGIGSHQLEIVRPDKSYSLFLLSLGHTCYEDLSFFLWYMDKNRPLPPGTAFDPYRQQDFERRKAVGFPLPLFPAAFETPEATPAQQAERNRIGGW